MPTWTVEQVLALAPDQASVSAGNALAAAGKWVAAGASGQALWGEAMGSGAHPYQVAVDLNEIAYKCSCPSRKFPCKHAIGLLLRYARNEIQSAETPEWVSDWIGKRSAPKSPPKSAGESDPKAAAKRAEKRWTNILSGIDECEAFLEDAVAQGLTSSRAARSWDQMAARMVDAQSPGLARRLRRVGASIGVGADWELRAASEMGRICLCIEGARNLDDLDPGLQSDIKTELGFAAREADLAEDGAVVDVWVVLGQAVEEDDRITTFRSWVIGMGTGRWAMHLAFSAAGQPPALRLLPGLAFAAMAKFFPSSWPLRATFSEVATCPLARPKGTNWEEAGERFCTGLSKNPWVEQIPVLLSEAQLAQNDERWFAVDRDGEGFPLIDRNDGCWRTLALTGGGPCDLFGEWNGAEFKLLSAFGPWGFVSL